MIRRVIAIGNRLMTDDAIGIVVTEEIKDWLIKENFDVIIGETDTDYYMSFVNGEGLLIILDAKHDGSNPGEVSVSNLCFKDYQNFDTQHDRTYAFNLYGENFNGYLIGIEVACIDIGLGLSDSLDRELHNICEQVKRNIKLIKYNFMVGGV